MALILAQASSLFLEGGAAPRLFLLGRVSVVRRLGFEQSKRYPLCSSSVLERQLLRRSHIALLSLLITRFPVGFLTYLSSGGRVTKHRKGSYVLAGDDALMYDTNFKLLSLKGQGMKLEPR